MKGQDSTSIPKGRSFEIYNFFSPFNKKDLQKKFFCEIGLVSLTLGVHTVFSFLWKKLKKL